MAWSSLHDYTGTANETPVTESLNLGHMLNWLEAMRDREQPNATVDHGSSHAITCIMAAEPYRSGKKLYWDP